MRILLFILGYLTFLSTNSFGQATQLDEQVILSRLSHLADSLMDAHQIPALGFGIIKDGKVILNEGFGYRDYENKLKTDANTLFAIGSCTKAFTAATLAILNDKELVDWHQPVKKYMPDFELYDEFATKETTPLDLLTHRSGLPRHDLVWYGSTNKRMELYDRLKYLEPTKSFRTTFQYQNLMYMTAGVLVEKVIGQSWEDFTKTQLIEPLEMTQTNFSVEDSKKLDNVAYPYAVEDGKIKRIDFRNIEEVGPAGAINSSINDMLKWTAFNLNRGKWKDAQIISETQFDILHTGNMIVDNLLGGRLQPQYGPFTYGGGWFICEYKGEKIVWHGGGIDGFSAMVWLIPEKNIGMVLICNVMSSSLPRVLANYATDFLLGHGESTNWAKGAWPAPKKIDTKKEEKLVDTDRVLNTQPSQPLKNYTGIFSHPGYGALNCQLMDNKLTINYNSLALSLRHYHYELFEGIVNGNENVTFKVQFNHGLDGSIQSVSIPLQAGLAPILFTRKN